MSAPTKPRASTLTLDGLARYIQANGPITLTEAIRDSGYGGNYAATKKDLYAFAAAHGRVCYSKEDKKWRGVSAVASTKWIPPVRPMTSYNLFANVRPDGMTFRAIPSRFR